MVRCCKCNVRGKSQEALINVGEDPSERGGVFFIIKGEEYYLMNTERVGLSIHSMLSLTKYESVNVSVMFRSNNNTVMYKVARPRSSGAYYMQLPKVSQMSFEGNVKDIDDYTIYVNIFKVAKHMGWSEEELMDGCKCLLCKMGYGDLLDELYIAMVPTLDKDKEGISLMQYVKEFLKFDHTKEDDNSNLATAIGIDIFGCVDDVLSDASDNQCIGYAKEYSKFSTLVCMVTNLFLLSTGNVKPSDRDSLSNKRILSPSGHLNLLVKQMWQRTLNNCKDFCDIEMVLTSLNTNGMSNKFSTLSLLHGRCLGK